MLSSFVSNQIFPAPTRSRQEYMDLINIPCYCEHKHCWIHYRKLEKAKGTILFSHGNAMDLNSDSLGFSQALSQATQCNVLVYDYCGYGVGKMEGQKPSEACCLANVTSCYNWLINQQWQTPDRIWAMGQSLGCVPSNWLAANKSIAGLVLVSPFKSLRAMGYTLAGPVLTNLMGIFVNMNGFANDNMAKHISCKVLIIHGTLDQVVHIGNALALCELYKGPVQKLWLAADHNDILSLHWSNIIDTIKKFQEQ